MYQYNICSQADETIFNKQCVALEKRLPRLIKRELLHDVDDSKIQKYEMDGKQILVYNDYYIGAVYIKSQFDLDQYFG